MKYSILKTLLTIGLCGACASVVSGAPTIEEFQIEGFVSPASPKALTTALEKELALKVVELDVRYTASGWPTLKVEFEEGTLTRADIEKVINSTEDPTGRKFKVHDGPPTINVSLLEQETAAESVLGDPANESPTMKNPVAADEASLARGKSLYDGKCAKCHGDDGDGTGPSSHGIASDPRKLWVFAGTGEATDGYLYWFITNGRNDMPPWGLVLSDNERWDLVNYIKSLKGPGQN